MCCTAKSFSQQASIYTIKATAILNPGYSDASAQHPLPSTVALTCTRRVGHTSCGEDRKKNPRTAWGHVCSNRFVSEMSDIFTFRHQNWVWLRHNCAWKCLLYTEFMDSFQLRDLWFKLWYNHVKPTRWVTWSPNQSKPKNFFVATRDALGMFFGWSQGSFQL